MNKMKEKEAYDKLLSCGLKPSVQRMAIMQYLLTHFTHPKVEDVYAGLNKKMPTLSRTTVYNTLRLLSDHKAVQMITIDEHRVCYDGNTDPHVHFYCKECEKVIDMFDQEAPESPDNKMINGNLVTDAQLYYKGICAECLKNKKQ